MVSSWHSASSLSAASMHPTFTTHLLIDSQYVFLNGIYPPPNTFSGIMTTHIARLTITVHTDNF